MTKFFEPGSQVIRIAGEYMNTREGGIYTVKQHDDSGNLYLECHDSAYDDDFFQQYIEPKKIPMDVIHEIAILDKDLVDMRDKLELLQISIDNRQLQLDTLKKEYGVV